MDTKHTIKTGDLFIYNLTHRSEILSQLGARLEQATLTQHNEPYNEIKNATADRPLQVTEYNLYMYHNLSRRNP